MGMVRNHTCHIVLYRSTNPSSVQTVRKRLVSWLVSWWVGEETNQLTNPPAFAAATELCYTRDLLKKS